MEPRFAKDSPRIEGYTLSTGRRIFSNLGIIGLSPRNDAVYEGYDGGLPCCDEWAYDPADRWTDEERAELAEYMIALWTSWKQRIGSHHIP